MAGLLVSVAEATPLPRLLERALYLVLKQRSTWDAIMPGDSRLQAFLRWLWPLLTPGASNGPCWLKEARALASLQLVVDASEAAFAGCVLHGGKVVKSIQVDFTPLSITCWVPSLSQMMMRMRLCCSAVPGEQGVSPGPGS